MKSLLQFALYFVFILSGSAIAQEKPEVSLNGADGVQFKFASIPVTSHCYIDILEGTGRNKGTFYLLPAPLISVDLFEEPIVHFTPLDNNQEMYQFKFGVYIPWDMNSVQADTNTQIMGNFLQTKTCTAEDAIKFHNKVADKDSQIRSLDALPLVDLFVEIPSLGKKKRIGNSETRFLNSKGRDQLLSFIVTKEEANALRRDIINGGLPVLIHYYFSSRRSLGYIKGDFINSGLSKSLEAKLKAADASGLVAEAQLNAAISDVLKEVKLNISRELSDNEEFNELADRLTSQFFTDNQRFLTEVTPIREATSNGEASKAKYSIEAVVNYAKSIEKNSFEFSLSSKLESSVVTTTVNFQNDDTPALNVRNYNIMSNHSELTRGKKDWVKIEMPKDQTLEIQLHDIVTKELEVSDDVDKVIFLNKEELTSKKVSSHIPSINDFYSNIKDVSSEGHFVTSSDEAIVAKHFVKKNIFNKMSGGGTFLVWGKQTKKYSYQKKSVSAVNFNNPETTKDIKVKFSNSSRVFSLNDLFNDDVILPQGITFTKDTLNSNFTIKFTDNSGFIQFQNNGNKKKVKRNIGKYFQRAYKKKKGILSKRTGIMSGPLYAPSIILSTIGTSDSLIFLKNSDYNIKKNITEELFESKSKLRITVQRNY